MWVTGGHTVQSADDYMGGYEEGYSLCAACLKKKEEERKKNPQGESVCQKE